MLIKFLKDYRGQETRELFLSSGNIADLEQDAALFLIGLGWAEVVAQPAEDKPAEEQVNEDKKDEHHKLRGTSDNNRSRRVGKRNSPK